MILVSDGTGAVSSLCANLWVLGVVAGLSSRNQSQRPQRSLRRGKQDCNQYLFSSQGYRILERLENLNNGGFCLFIWQDPAILSLGVWDLGDKLKHIGHLLAQFT